METFLSCLGAVMDKTWTCTRCTFQNSPLNIRCVMCETRKATNPETGEWKCLKCTFSFNPPWIKVCDTCGTPREELAASAPPPKENPVNCWHCPSCTYKCNELFLTTCKMCGATNPRVVPVEGTTWTCSTCTLVNMIGSDKCQACDAPMPELALKTPDGGWICFVCTYKNTEGTKCKLCHAEQKASEAEVPEKKWQCLKCMHSNSSSLYKCEMCRSPYRTSGGVDVFTSISSSVPTASEDEDELRSLPTETIFKSQQAEIMKIWENICQFCRVHNTYFVDDSFLPRPQSISWSLQRPYINSVVKWFRPHEISRHPWTVYKNPTPDDIVQGNVGDCWLLCALAVIAERKELVENLIPNQYNPYGVFHVRLYLNGQWKTIIVDDLLPCDENGRMFFSRAKRNQLWVPLVEKAMAKMYGCYEALAGGTCLEGLYSLTGAPCISLDLDSESEDETWAYLLSSWESGFLVACACGNNQTNASDTQDYWQVGLKKDHAYSVLDVQEVEGNRLVKIRNPWSWFSWNGDWSKGSSLWEAIKPETKKRLLSNCGDGQFWMCFSDVRRNFYNMQVCKVRSDWREMRVRGEFLPHAGVPLKVHILTVPATSEFDISVFQDSNRSCIKEGKPWLPVDILLIVFKYNKYGRNIFGDLVECKRKIAGVISINPVLEAGEYVVVCLAFNHWKVEYNGQCCSSPAKKVIPFTLVFHCTKDFLLQELCPKSKRYNEKYLLADTIIQLILEKGRREHFANNVQVCSLVKGWAGTMIMVENLSSVHQATISIICDPQKCNNIVSTRATLSSIDVIPPMHRQVVMILTQKDKVKPYHVSYSLKFGHISGVLHDPPLSVMVKGLHTPRHI